MFKQQIITMLLKVAHYHYRYAVVVFWGMICQSYTTGLRKASMPSACFSNRKLTKCSSSKSSLCASYAIHSVIMAAEIKNYNYNNNNNKM